MRLAAGRCQCAERCIHQPRPAHVTLSATDVQGALEELEQEIDDIDERTVELFTLTAPQISGGVTLGATPAVVTDTVMHIKGASGQFYGDDFTVSGTTLSFSLTLQGILSAGDKITVIYGT